MPEADDRLSAYKLKRTAIFALLSFLLQTAVLKPGGGACFTEVNAHIPSTEDERQLAGCLSSLYWTLYLQHQNPCFSRVAVCCGTRG